MMRGARWYSGLYSAMIAGFEAYGSAQIGMAPSSLQTGNVDAEIEECPAWKIAGLATCNQPVAKIHKAPPVLNGRICPSKTAVDVMWRHV